MTRDQDHAGHESPRRVVSIRGGLLAAFAIVVLLVSGSLLTVSLFGTARLARDTAGSLMFVFGRNAEFRLHDLFDPIEQKLIEDYAAIRQGRYSAKEVESSSKLLAPTLFSQPHVDSMLLCDQTGTGVLAIRYSESVHDAAFLRPVVDRLPAVDPSRLQFVTREFRSNAAAAPSRFALWDDAGQKLVQAWTLEMPGYEPRQRPWYKAAMDGYRDRPLAEAQAAGSSLVGWTEPYMLFVTRSPGISGVVAARDPAGVIQIVSYNLPLGDIARFTTTVKPSPHGTMFVMTDDERLLGPTRASGSEDKPMPGLLSLRPIADAGFPKIASAVQSWHAAQHGQSERFRLAIDGEKWWAGFTPFQIGSQHRLWIGMLVPESDLVPAARQNQWLIAAVGLLSLLAAAVLAVRLARWFSQPLADLAGQSRRIASLDLSAAEPVRSRLTELNSLSATLGQMRAALSSYITNQREAADRQRNLEGQLREAQKLEAVGLLAGGIAHDFNNLLQVIGGNASLARYPMTESADRDVALGEIHAAVNRASQLTRQLLTFGRRQALQRERVEINNLVTNHLAMIRRLVPSNIRFDCRPAPRAVVTIADKGQLEQVLLNLCLNARDAMPGGGQLSIAVEQVTLDTTTAEQLCQQPPGPFVRLTVSDTGQGVSEEALPRIFEPFFSTKPRDQGSGLGLAVVYGIVRQHGGHILVRSEPGQGTEFIILLPCVTEQEAPVVAASPATPILDPDGPVLVNVLLAEDNKAVRKVAQRVLSQLGARVTAAVDGHQAVDLFAADPEQFDLLFLDVMMPGLSGFEVAARCRALRPDIRVLFASGYAAESLVAPGEDTANETILRKPYDPEALRTAVRQLAPFGARDRSASK